MFHRRSGFVLLALFVCAAFAPATRALAGEKAESTPAHYGAKLSDADTVPVSKLLAAPEEYVGKKVKIEGRILGVCEMRGCWIEIAGDKDLESIRFKVKDGDIVFPVEAKGKMAVAEGTFEKIQLDLEQTRQMKEMECKEKGEKFEPDSCTQPGVLYRIAGLGAVVQ
jgi:hypothetical protein